MAVARKSRGKGPWHPRCPSIASHRRFVCRPRISIHHASRTDPSWEKEAVKVCLDHSRNHKRARDFCRPFASLGHLECSVAVIWIDKNIDFIVSHHRDRTSQLTIAIPTIIMSSSVGFNLISPDPFVSMSDHVETRRSSYVGLETWKVLGSLLEWN